MKGLTKTLDAHVELSPEVKKDYFSGKAECPLKLWKIDVKKINPKYDVRGSYAIIEGPKGLIVTEDDFVHQILKSDSDKFYINGYTIHPKNEETGYQSVEIFPSAEFGLSADDVRSLSTDEEVSMKSFSDYFGGTKSRVRSNYKEFQKSIKDIGIKEKGPEWEYPDYRGNL